jgi:REP element-mobilizing transposase RayT
MALAYFITFTTYGTWLHGADKGMGSVDRAHNEFGAPFVRPDDGRAARSRGEMAQPAYVMGAAERAVVRDAIVAVCGERGWQVMAVHVRSNHVHVVVAAERDAGRVMADLKARASRALTRAGFGDADRRRWTRHGSTLHLFDAATVADKVDYTLHRQGEPMAVYNGAAAGTEGAAHGGTPE